MKGRTTCPKCKHEISLDVPDDCKKHDVVCPKCKNKFIIQPTIKDGKKGEECYWEEHGEPRKTVLSSVKPKTNKPIIAAVLLICVFAIGIATTAFSEIFIESSMDTFSAAGLKGNVELYVSDQLNNSLGNVSISIDKTSRDTNANGSASIKDVTLGIQNVELSLSGYKTLTQEILVFPFVTSSHEITMEQGSDSEYMPFDTIGCSVIIAIFSVFALLGAITSLKRRNFDAAAVGSFIGIFTLGFLLIGSILSIVAFILIMKSKEEFRDGKKGRIF